MSTPPLSAARRLIAYWTSIGASVTAGATEQDVRAFEDRHRVCLPGDFRDYLALCNGLSPEAGGHFPTTGWHVRFR